MKKLTKIAILLSLICMPLLTQAMAYTIETVPSPKEKGQDYYVSNPDTVLTPMCEDDINGKLINLQRNTEVEMAVVVINEYDENHYGDAYSFAIKLFNHWGIGDKDKNTGLLLFLARRSRKVELITGDGLEGIMTDLACGEILDKAVPSLKENNYDEGVQIIVKEVEDRLMQDKNRAELLLGWKPADTEDSDYLAGYLVFGFILMIVFAYLAYKKLNGKPGQSKKEIQDQSKDTQTCLGCLMFIFPIPLLFFYLYYRYARKHVKVTPPNCKQCGHAMTQAPQDEEAGYLDKGKQVEKKLESYDYSLWVCPQCGEHEFLQHKGPQFGKYDDCPSCGARAAKLTDHKIITNATYQHKGEQLNSYVCQCCGHTMQKTVVLPKKEYSSSSSSSGSSGGGYHSSSSGSWGGGHSSGGGAGRSF